MLQRNVCATVTGDESVELFRRPQRRREKLHLVLLNRSDGDYGTCVLAAQLPSQCHTV